MSLVGLVCRIIGKDPNKVYAIELFVLSRLVRVLLVCRMPLFL